MRVLLVTDKSLPQAGGSQTQLHNLYRRFPPGTVTMLSRRYRDAGLFDDGAPYAIRRVPFVDLPKARMPLLWRALRAATPGVAREFGADQVHCGQALETGWIGLWCKRKLGLPYLVHTYLEEITVYRRGRVTGPLIRRALVGADAVTTISQFCRGQLTELGVPPDRIHLTVPGVEPPTIDPESVCEIRRRYNLADRAVILTVGRLAPRKGHDRVIRALPRIAAAVPSVAYLIVGQGPERARLEALTLEVGVSDRVIFAGSVADTGPFYGVADLFVMANLELANGDVEGFGIVFLEAGSAGLPVIGGRTGGVTEAIAHGQTGYLVDPNNSDELAEALTTLLCDRELARKMGEAGRARARDEFTWEKTAATLQRISESLSAASS